MPEQRYGGLTCAEASDLAAGFVLDSLAPAEAAAVRAHLAACPQSHPEFAELGAVVPALLESVPIVVPAAGLRARVLEAAAGAAPARLPEPVGVPRPEPRSPVRDRSGLGGRLALPRWPVAAGLAAVLAIVALGAWNVSLQRDLDGATRYARAISAALDLAAKPGSVSAVLAPSSAGGPAGLAAVGRDGSVAIAVRGLTATSGREVYEAWAIVGTNAPVPIGGFTVGPDGYGVLAVSGPTASAGTVIALTREPVPDATAPTLPIVSSGAAVGQPG